MNALSSNAHPPIANGCWTVPFGANSTFILGIVCSKPIAWRRMLIVPSLGMVVEGTVKAPVPDSGDATDNVKPDGSIVHEQPAGAGIVSVPVPPEGPNTVAVAVASNAHGSVTTAAAIQGP